MKISCVILFSLTTVFSFGQQGLQLDLGKVEQQKIDSLRKVLNSTSNDSVRFQASNMLSGIFQHKNRDSAIHYLQRAYTISLMNQKELAEAEILMKLQHEYRTTGNLADSYKSIIRAIEIAADPSSEGSHFIQPTDNDFKRQRLEILAILHGGGYGDLLVYTRNYEESIRQYKEGIRIIEEIGFYRVLPQFYLHLSWAYRGLNKYDSAIYSIQLAEQTAKERNINYHIEFILNGKGDVLFEQGKFREAIESFRKGLKAALDGDNTDGILHANQGISNCFLVMEQADSALSYALKVQRSTSAAGKLPETQYYKVYENIYGAYHLLEKKDSAFKYLELAKQAKDAYNKSYIDNLSTFQNLFLQDRIKLQALEKEKLEQKNKTRTYLLLGGIGLLLLLSVVFYNTIRHKQKANESITIAFNELKTTQSQLIQSEKMASLGELTAGIAHEIQNPLNFVNNFSEVNKELAQELEHEIEKGNSIEVRALAKDIKENQDKILHHGKRADAIVKGMLQHSRASSGQKELTDINALCDEYLRLSYHGLRAKDKSFNAKLETGFDKSRPIINVVPQEIGRVILNLINNAFYEVTKKSKQQQGDYEPTVTVSTKKSGDQILISVKDNGGGIPDSIREKIFQPFFTTKPTGQGTGLGLSLSYDIVKAHGGELRVETTEGEGSEFIIHLPL